MALLFMDGFGGGDWNFKWDAGSGSYTPATATPRIPGGYYWTNGSGGAVSMVKNFPASSRVFIGYGWYTSSDNSPVAFYGDNGATQHITVVRNASRFLEIRRGTSAGTLLATGTTQIFNSQWNYIEVSATISDTVGEVHVRLNGSATDEVSYVGDTKNGGTANTIDRFVVTFPNAFSNYMADLYILNDTGTVNNNFLGDVTVRTLSPSGNGNSSQLVGSDGNSTDNYLLVDERPYSSTDYVGSGTVGQKDTYIIANLPAGVSIVHAVQLNGMMAKSDVSLAQARYVLRSGGTDFAGTTQTLATTYTGYYQLYEQDPATSAAWTAAGVNNIESGMEVV